MKRYVALAMTLAGLTLWLAGCVTVPVYTALPLENDALGLDQGETGFSVLLARLKAEKKPVFVFESENTLKTLRFLKGKRGAYFLAPLAAADFNEQYFVSRLAQTLESFGVSLTDGSLGGSPVTPAGPKIEVEVQLELGDQAFDTTTFVLSLFCFDETGKLVGTFHRVGKGMIAWPARTFAVQPATNSALEQLAVFLKG